ncbi:unnamed protein product [Polarella glacialis]|uniref:Uncharacterized protein n=1 Tax=Polarella glacialis TaxID=89957 RepID=A0A813DL29_POLGL|nr:unnamed protein product [Polarella glacialis]
MAHAMEALQRSLHEVQDTSSCSSKRTEPTAHSADRGDTGGGTAAANPLDAVGGPSAGVVEPVFCACASREPELHEECERLRSEAAGLETHRGRAEDLEEVAAGLRARVARLQLGETRTLALREECRELRLRIAELVGSSVERETLECDQAQLGAQFERLRSAVAVQPEVRSRSYSDQSHAESYTSGLCRQDPLQELSGKAGSAAQVLEDVAETPLDVPARCGELLKNQLLQSLNSFVLSSDGSTGSS